MQSNIKKKFFSTQRVEDNHKKYKERVRYFFELGFDQEEARKNIIKNIVPNCRNVLEIGTGKGYLTARLAKKYEAVTTVDISEEDQTIAMLNVAYAKVLDKVDFIINSSNGLGFPDNSFDAVVSAFTFHHMVSPYPVINEMVRVFNKVLVISDFNIKGYEIVDKAHKQEGRVHHTENNDLKELMEYLKKKNLAVSEIEDTCQKIVIAKKKS